MRNRIKSFSIVTLGCPKNTVDSEVLKGGLIKAGLKYKENPEGVDLLVINTCGFIEPAREETVEAILEAVNLKKQNKIKSIAVVGCLVQLYKDELKEEIPEVDFYSGVDFQKRLYEEIVGGNYYFPRFEDRDLLTPGHYAYIKISDGCDNKCSFCSIPLIKGKQKSRTVEDIINEVKYLNTLGVKELILVSQDTTRYGTDLPSKDTLPELLEKILRFTNASWIRLLYCNPDFWPDDLIDLVRDHDKICKYLDIPIQHFSDKILRSMKRVKSASMIKNLLYEIRSKIPDVAIRTSVIVGYPGETEKEFLELVDFIEEFRFDRLGVFTYSPEENTEAYLLKDDIPQKEKDSRRDFIMQKQWEIMEDRAESIVGKEIDVLVDCIEENNAVGRTQWDAPEIDCVVKIRRESIEIETGEIYRVKIVDNDGIDLVGEIKCVEDK
ncbi:MAG: 30S ribosomal protein S12 methylthiotransferase RimO [Candidatus Marinimicrobia bacterium]|nr:30S ribosomal protein S12 methylthiotransferase RimO [Candidatus Neomarinimicrobiota bacterium]